MPQKPKNNLTNFATNFLTLLTGLFVGIVLGAGLNSQFHNQFDHNYLSSAHTASHPQLEIPAGQLIPTIDLSISPDAKSGWNLMTTTENFTFAPEQASRDHQPNQGHAHLYIDDIKITRLYSNWYHIPSLKPGDHQIKVTLNTNNHQDYTYNGEIIQASTNIKVK